MLFGLHCYWHDWNVHECAQQVTVDWSTLLTYWLFSVCRAKNSSLYQIDNNFPWSVLLPTIEMMSMQVASPQSFEILSSFLWSIREQTMENCSQFVFAITLAILTSTCVEVSWKIGCARKRKTNCATIKSFPWSVLLTNIALDLTAHKKSFSHGKKVLFGIKKLLIYKTQEDDS